MLHMHNDSFENLRFTYDKVITEFETVKFMSQKFSQYSQVTVYLTHLLLKCKYCNPCALALQMPGHPSHAHALTHL